MQWVYPLWYTTDAQDKKLLDDDISGWMKTIHEENDETGFQGHPYQYSALHDYSVDKAVQLISTTTSTTTKTTTTTTSTGGGGNGNDDTATIPPEVFVLTCDCMEASLRLLTERFPQFIDASYVEQFITESPKKLYANQRGGNVSSSGNDKEKKKPNEFNTTQVKKLHRELFSDDWIFYKAALIQFRRQLVESSLNPSEIKECLEILDQKIKDIGQI